MLDKNEAKKLFDETREWSYWTEHIMHDKEQWECYIKNIRDMCKWDGTTDEEFCIKVIQELSKLGVSRAKIAAAIMDYAFMACWERDDSYKDYIKDGKISDEDMDRWISQCYVDFS